MVLTYGLMLILVVFLIFMLLFQVRKSDNDTQFFDLANTQAMRGFWCIVVMLVHVHSAYTNRLQDMIGSFAYIGVTFFFMASAYGLKQKQNNLQHFWRRRLPKLLVPCFVSNIFLMGMEVVREGHVEWQDLIYINHWVAWLIVCYVIYWSSYKFIKHAFSDVVVVVGVFFVSMIMYLLKLSTSYVTWPTEVWGFVWGILLAHYRERLLKASKNKWLMKEFVCVIAAGVLGLLYLKYKYVIVWGDYLLKIILGIAILLVLLVANTHISIGNKIGYYMGKISYEVYLLHGGVYLLIAYCYPKMNSGVYIFVCIVVTVILSIITHYVSGLCNETIGKLLQKTKKEITHND